MRSKFLKLILPLKLNKPVQSRYVRVPINEHITFLTIVWFKGRIVLNPSNKEVVCKWYDLIVFFLSRM